MSDEPDYEQERLRLNKERSAFAAYDDSAHWDEEQKITRVSKAELVINLEAHGWKYQPEG